MSHTLGTIRESFRQDGFVVGTGLFLKNLYRRRRFWLLVHHLGADHPPADASGNVRAADASLLDKIAAAWPEEFGGVERKRYVSRKLVKRFENGYPCLASERDGRVEGAVWCIPWEFDDKLRPTKSPCDAFEICNLFVTPECRGKGVGRQLLAQALLLMAQQGKKTAYSRVLPERQSSVALHLRSGFSFRGVIDCTTILGRQRNRFVPLTKVRCADGQGTTMPACVLLAGGFWGGTLEAVRSLGYRGVPVYVFVFGRDPTPYARSRYCRHANRLNGQDAASVSQELIEWCKARKFSQRPLLLPMTDILSTWVAETKRTLEHYFTVGTARPETIFSLLDKGRAHSLATSCGLDVPLSKVAKSASELKDIADTMKYPAIAKPVWWRDKRRADFKTVTFETSEALVCGLTPVLDGGTSVLVQEYIEGRDNDIETFMFYRDHRGVTWGCTGRKLRQSPPNAGIMASGHAVDIPDLRRVCTQFLDKIDYQGLGGVEFKRCARGLVYIETSARPEGFHGLARKAGFDLVWLAYCDYCLGGLCEEPHSQREAFYLNWHAFWATYGLRNVIPWVADLLRMLSKQPLKMAVFEWRDPRPSLYLMRKGLRERCGRILRKLGQAVHAAICAHN